MPNNLWMIGGAALLFATSASAQNNADTAVGNEANVGAPIDTDAAVDANLVDGTRAVDNAVEPVTARADPGLASQVDDNRDDDRGFPWGIVGLVGLVGLLGRRKNG